MRALLALVLSVLLFAGLAGGSVVHAMELATAGEVTASTEWLHSDGDHDHVPADADRNYPHHHNHCQGHDVAAPLKALASAEPSQQAVRLRPAATRVMRATPLEPALRPPIA